MRLLLRAMPVLVLGFMAGCGSPEQMPVTPEITTASLDDATVGIPYSGRLEAKGGTGPYTWELVDLPLELTWLSVVTEDSTVGKLSGTPGENGEFFFTARVTDSKERTSTRTMRLFIKACEGDTTVCYYASGEQCYQSSLPCIAGNISGTCAGGGLSSSEEYCGSACGVCNLEKADSCTDSACMCGPSPACSSDDTCCGGSCVDTKTDASYCGNCTTVCQNTLGNNAQAVCKDGQCVSECDGNSHGCQDGKCYQNTDIGHCGASCAVCNVANANNTCTDDKCEFTCNGGYHTCGTDISRCYSNNDASHCPDNANPGSCKECPNTLGDNAHAVCNNGTCGSECDDNSHGCQDGKCYQNTDTNHCGTSCVACNVANANNTCTDSKCSFTCNSGYCRSGNGCVSHSNNFDFCGSSCQSCDSSYADNCSGGHCRCGIGSACSGNLQCCYGSCRLPGDC